MKPVVSSVHHAAQDGLADDQLPEELSRLPGKRLVLSSLRKLVIGAPVVQIVRDNLCFADRFLSRPHLASLGALMLVNAKVLSGGGPPLGTPRITTAPPSST